MSFVLEWVFIRALGPLDYIFVLEAIFREISPRLPMGLL